MSRKILEFAEIDELFLKYKGALNIKGNEQFLLTQRSLIIEALWVNLSEKKISSQIEEFPDEMVKVVCKCLEKYSEKNDYIGFCQYTFTAIKNRLSTFTTYAVFDEKTKGMHVSDEYRLLQNKLRRLYKSFVSLRSSNETEEILNSKFVDYASKYLDIEKSIVIDFLYPKEACSNEIASQDSDDSLNLFDLYKGNNSETPENELVGDEKNNMILSQINDEWKKQKNDAKPLMSELLTLIVLNAIDKGYLYTGTKTKEDVYKMLAGFDFISEYLINCKSELPTQLMIGEKYNISKSGVSKKITRFFEKLNNQ